MPATVSDSSPTTLKTNFLASGGTPGGGGMVTQTLTFNTAGTYNITVEAQDKAGNVGKKTIQVKVTNTPQPLAPSRLDGAAPQRSTESQTPACLAR